MISSDKTRRIGTRTLTLVLAFSVAALVAPGVSHAKPSPGSPLNAAVCKSLYGVWEPATYTCTIRGGVFTAVSSSFKIGYGVTLDIKGKITIPYGLSITNAGTITVENQDGPAQADENGVPLVDASGIPFEDHDWATGLLVLGTLDNSGIITIKNEVTGTEGITVSFSLAAEFPPEGPSPAVVLPGALINSGTIIIQNRAQTRGIKTLGTIVSSGTIRVENRVSTSAGIYLRREDELGDPRLPATFKIEGTLTNTGIMSVSNSGEGYSGDGNYCGPLPTDPCGYGVYNQGLFTNSAAGEFAIHPSPVAGDPARGLFNGGSITSYGTFINDRGIFSDAQQTWGSFNGGTMINYGTTTAKGTWANGGVMINLGTVTNGTETSYGVMYDVSPGHTMLNYGTIYNYGWIKAGVNQGICIDKGWLDADGNAHNGKGC